MSTPKEEHTTQKQHQITSEELNQYNHVIESLIEKGDVQRILEDTDYEPENVEKTLEEELTTREYWQVAREILNANISTQNQELRENDEEPETKPYMDLLDLYSHVRRLYPEDKLEEEKITHSNLTSTELEQIPEQETVTSTEEVQWNTDEEHYVKITEPERYAHGTSSFPKLSNAYWKEVNIGEGETKFKYVGEIPVDET